MINQFKLNFISKLIIKNRDLIKLSNINNKNYLLADFKNLRYNSVNNKKLYSTFNYNNRINIKPINSINKFNNNFQKFNLRSFSDSKDNEQIKRVKEINKEKQINKKEKNLIVKLKYFLLRQNRPFNIDEITAFFSWILMGNFIWIFIGTTTFFGVILYIVNWIDDGEIEKVLLKNLLTFDNKLNVNLNEPNFKSSWEDGKIKIRNLKIESNYYKLKISEIYLTFSFNKWFEGKGLINEIEIEGLEGDINIFKDEDILLLDESFNDKYELNHIKVKHSKINFHSEKYFNKPLELIVFNCDMDKLRREWIVYDFLNANTMFGSLDGSLFTLHKRQHKFAHFSGMDLHNENDDFNNIKMNYINKGINNGKDLINKSAIIKYNDDNKKNKTNEIEQDNNYRFYDEFNDNDDNSKDNLFKKTTRLRIDMLDLSFLNNKNSKLNWIESGKAEIIFDIMLPNEEEQVLDNNDNNKNKNNNNNNNNNNNDNNNNKEMKLFETQINYFKDLINKIYKKLKDEEIIEEKMNKYVVIDMKINYYNLTAKFPEELPCSSLTGLPYISSQDLQSLVTFINDEKFGLSSSNKYIIEEDNDDDFNEINNNNNNNNNSNNFDGEEDNSDYKDFSDGFELNEFNEIEEEKIDENGNKIRLLPAIKFRIVQNLKDFEYIDLPSLINFSNMKKPDDNCNEKVMKSFINTNKFIDNSIVEVLSLLLVYKEEIQTRLIEMYSRRSGFEILFNNFILGNLILVGLGSFVI